MTRPYCVSLLLLVGVLLGGAGCDTTTSSPGEPRVISAPGEPGASRRSEHPLARACDKGDLKSCVSFASRLLMGRGVERDLNASLTYYDEACKKDYPAACHGQAVVLRDVIKKKQSVD